MGELRLNWDIDARLRSHKIANELGVSLVPVNYANGAVTQRSARA